MFPSAISHFLQGFYGSFRDFTVPSGISRFLQGFYGSVRDFTVPSGISRFRQGFHGSVRDFTVPSGISRFRQGFDTSFRRLTTSETLIFSCSPVTIFLRVTDPDSLSSSPAIITQGTDIELAKVICFFILTLPG